jgi:hypothetical protein
VTGTASDCLAWLDSQIGTRETPPGSNRVPYWLMVNRPDLEGKSWCCALALSALLAVGVEPVSRSFWVWTVEADYLAAGRLYPVEQAIPGDQLIYRIGNGHTGICKKIDPINRQVVAVEGNTSSGRAGSQTDGDGVWERTRSWSIVKSVGRPLYAEPPRPLEEPVIFLSATDPQTGGLWQCDPTNGAIYAWDRTGGPGGRYLGALNTHPDWHAGVAGNPVIAFGGWTDDDGRPGYQIWTREPASGLFHRYAFPSNGAARIDHPAYARRLRKDTLHLVTAWPEPAPS